MKNNTGPVWVIAEQIDCRIPSITFQLLGQARKLADELKTTVEAVLLGNKMKDQPRQLIAAGADRVYFGNAPGFEVYQSEIYTKVIVDLARHQHPKIMLIGSTSVGRELAPLVAARLKTGLTAHCIDLVINENGLLDAKIPAYGGLISIICPEKRPQMATVAGGVFENPDPDENRTGEITVLAAPDLNSFRVQTLETVTENPKGVPLESAPIVVACGAGGYQLPGLVLHFISQKHSFDRGLQFVGQFPRLTEKLKRYAGNSAVNLLGNHPNRTRVVLHLVLFFL
ncbi:MAG TPA: electron transfer flavoprotein subunit alpha/FixB family protein [Desulfobacterales bacterium]|nr:electron transfer flavoprotein subunit alpha/FixB family protein [Desulfobacterales bacterium]